MFSKICLLNSYLRAGRRPGRALSPSSLTAPSGSACTHCIAQIPYACSLKAPTHFIHPTASCCPPSTSTHTARWPGRTWALCKTKKQNLLTSGRGRAHGGRTFPFQQTALMTWSVVWTQLRLWLDLCSPEIFIYAIASSLKRNPTKPFCKDVPHRCFDRTCLGQQMPLSTFIRAAKEHLLQEGSQQLSALQQHYPHLFIFQHTGREVRYELHYGNDLLWSFFTLLQLQRQQSE